MSSSFEIYTSSSSLFPNLSVCESKSKVSGSLAEPAATYRNCTNSLFDLRAAPSAMLTGIETAALLIWEIIPNFSSAGKPLVTKYASLAKSKLFCHTSNFLCGFIELQCNNLPVKNCHSQSFTDTDHRSLIQHEKEHKIIRSGIGQ